MGVIPGSGRSPGGGHGNPLRILAGRIPWTEEPSGLRIRRVTQSQARLKRQHALMQPSPHVCASIVGDFRHLSRSYQQLRNAFIGLGSPIVRNFCNKITNTFLTTSQSQGYSNLAQ